MVWFGAAFCWDSWTILACALVRVAIDACVVSKAFSSFTKYTVISWGVYELYSTIFFSINGGTGAYLVKYTMVLFYTRISAGIWMASISAGVSAFSSSVYGVLPVLFPCASIFFGSTLNVMADSSSPWNTKAFLTPCPNSFL